MKKTTTTTQTAFLIVYIIVFIVPYKLYLLFSLLYDTKWLINMMMMITKILLVFVTTTAGVFIVQNRTSCCVHSFLLQLPIKVPTTRTRNTIQPNLGNIIVKRQVQQQEEKQSLSSFDVGGTRLYFFQPNAKRRESQKNEDNDFPLTKTTSVHLSTTTGCLWLFNRKQKEEEEKEYEIALREEEEKEKEKEKNMNNAEPISMFDIRKEYESSQQLFNRLLIFDNIGKIINGMLYTFVIVGIILNLFGYAYVPQSTTSSNNVINPIKLEIGTIEQRKFQLEIQKSMKQKQIEQQQQQKEQLLDQNET